MLRGQGSGGASAALPRPCSCHSIWLFCHRSRASTGISTLAAKHPTLCVKFIVALGLSVGATGCSTSAIDSIPQWAGGKPESAPERPATAMEYPPVNDRPPARDSRVVSEEEQAKIERELAAARDAQAKKALQVKKERAGMIANQPKPAAAKTPPSGN